MSFPKEDGPSLRSRLRGMPLESVLAEGTSVSMVQGEALLRLGALKAFEWKNSETALHVHVEDRSEDYVVRITPQEGELGFRMSCTCFPGGKMCRHAMAAVLGIQAAVTGRYPPTSLFVEKGDWEKLEAQFDGRISAPVEETGKSRSFGYVLVDLDDPRAFHRFRFVGSNSGRETLFGNHPPELSRILQTWLPVQEREVALAEWLESPVSDYGIKVLRNGKTEEVVKTSPVRMEAETTLDLREGRPVLRRIHRRLDGEEPAEIEDFTCVVSRLFFFHDGRFGWVEEDRGSIAWEAALKISETGDRWKLPAAVDQLEFDAEHWNGVCFPWKTGDDPAVLRNGEPVKKIPEGKVEALLRATEIDGEVILEPLLRAHGVEMNHALLAIVRLEELLDSMPRAFVSSAERCRIFLTAGFAIFAAQTAKERKAIIAKARKEPVVARIKHGSRTIWRFLQAVESVVGKVPKESLHCARIGEEETWFTVREGVPWMAALAGLVVDAVPRARPEDGDLWAGAADFYAGLPDLFAACERAGVGFSLNGAAVEPMKLDFLVRAERDAGDLDWFALSPEVLADGSAIPQEKWDQLMSGALFREEGKLRVLDAESAATLSKLREVLRLQTEENSAGKKRKNEALRVPRLRMFDWLALRKAGVRCELPPEEAEVLEALASFEKLPEFPVPKGLRATMRPYQKEGYEWLAFLYRNRFGACLADDMGLGKTLQTIALLAGIREGIVGRPGEGKGKRKKAERPHLVVLPPTLLFNWRHEIETFYPELRVEEYTGAQRDLEAIEADAILTTYELARRDIEILEKRDFDVIVFDEAQAIKNLAGERSKAMRRLKGRFKICLTGTPLENHAGEYYSILELALPGLFGDYRRFMKSLNGEGFQPLDRARPFVLRRTKEKILRELPAKVESDVWLELTQTQKTFYSRAVAEVREEVFRAFKDKTAQQAGIVALAALTRLRQICVSPALIDPEHAEMSPKIEYMIAKAVELGEEGHAALIFSQFTKTLDLMERHLAKEKIEFLRMDGTTPQAKRKEYVAGFQKANGPPVFLISLKTGGVGLNLTRASYVFHLDPWWNPAVENQASDRAHRIGQKQRVFVNRLLMRHTVEEKMMLLKERKRELFEQVFSGSENRTGSGLLTREDMAWLLE